MAVFATSKYQEKQVECKRMVLQAQIVRRLFKFISTSISVSAGTSLTFVSASELDGKEAVAKMARSRAAERRI